MIININQLVHHFWISLVCLIQGKTRFCLNELDGIRRASFDKKLFLQVEESNDSDIDEAPRKKRKLMDDSSSNTRGQTDVTLHAFIKSIAFFGDDVVVDDCNHLARLRQSFTSVLLSLLCDISMLMWFILGHLPTPGCLASGRGDPPDRRASSMPLPERIQLGESTRARRDMGHCAEE